LSVASIGGAVSLHIVNSPAAATEALGDVPGPVVVVPIYNSPDDVRLCVESLLRHTSTDTALLLIDDASPDPTTLDSVFALEHSLDHRVVVFRHLENTGFVGSCNDAFRVCAGRDVVLVNSDLIVSAEWLTRLVAAARTSNTVATVSTLTNHGTILSVPRRNEPGPMPDGLTPDEAARRVAAAAKLTRPVIPTGIGHCLYVTRAAIDVVGDFDLAFAPGYGEEVDFCQRAAARGFINIVADDVFTYHKGGSSFGVSPAKLQLQADHEAIINRRYPLYASSVQWASTSNRSALATALAVARRALVGTRVAVDGLCLGEQLMGTQRFVVETAVALSNQDDVAETHLFVPLDVPDYVTRATADHPRLHVHPIDGYELVDDHYDVVVRPYQVDHIVQLQWMRAIADASVVTQLDLIAYHNPAYFGTPVAWQRYRDVTEFAFDTVDGVAFISNHSLDEATREGLLSSHQQSAITYCGVDHRSGLLAGVQPAGAPQLQPGFVLSLGANYLHKHRVFTLELWGLLRERGFQGQLALVGARPPNGNTTAAEDAWLAAHPVLAPHVVRLDSVGEAEKAWLQDHAALLMYPTLSEGFGMVPFEAAQAGVPVLTTRQGALDEVLPVELATTVSLVPEHNVELAERLLHDQSFRDEQVALLVAACERFTWEASAVALVDLVHRTLESPAGRRSFSAPSNLWVHQSRVVDRTVSVLRDRPRLHRILIGDDTRRQRTLRRGANWARRRFK
jgi:GT2 family glycosyltransferase/glycosyltransferase involved in cell wall biosynthesis